MSDETRKALAEQCAIYRDEIERLRTALTWYGEQARLCRLIHSEGDTGRQALSEDGGKRARDAIAEKVSPKCDGENYAENL